MTENLHIDSLNQKKFVLGVDVGGTSIKPKLYQIEGEDLADHGMDVTSIETKSIKGKTGHVAQMLELFSRAETMALENGGKLVAIGVGTPGRYKNDVIKPHTATNLDCPNNASDTMDNVNLAREYKNSMAGTIRGNIALEVHNDADMMLTGMLNALNHGKATAKDQDGLLVRFHELKKSQVALFGLGTGVGHSIKKLDKEGNGVAITDGHASKLLLKVDAEDVETMQKVEAWLKKDRPDIKTPVHYAADGSGRVIAEDLFKDGTFRAIADLATAKDASIQDNPQHKSAADFVGKYMARAIEAIASGNNEDQIPEQGWSAEDKAAAAKTEVYLVGGGLARGEVGEEIIRAAKAELKNLADAHDNSDNHTLAAKLAHIRIAQYQMKEVEQSNDAAEHAAAESALNSYLSKQLSR